MSAPVGPLSHRHHHHRLPRTWATTSGAIRPARAGEPAAAGTENFYFLADYHALIKCDEPARIQRSTLEIAACWLAAGLDPEQVFFYRQSDIPEIPS
jgi:tryptophanyl-tRNA synthetase